MSDYAMYDDDDDPDALDECWHEDYEVTWEGRAYCHCGHAWWMTSQEFSAHLETEAEYHKAYYAEIERENSWRGRLDRWLSKLVQRFSNIWRTPDPVTNHFEDEVPF